MASILVQKRRGSAQAACARKSRGQAPQNSSGFAAANERSVLVIELVRDVTRPGLGGDEFHFAHQCAAPSLVDLRAELALHFLQLLPPGLAVSCYLQASLVTAHRTRVPRQSFSHHAGPHAREPRDGSLRTFQLAQHSTQKISSAFHGSGILAHTRVLRAAPNISLLLLTRMTVLQFSWRSR